MAKKKASTSAAAHQATMFDVPAIAQVAKVKDLPSAKERSTDVRFNIRLDNIGLNAVWEGRSQNYKDFSDYIKKSNILK